MLRVQDAVEVCVFPTESDWQAGSKTSSLVIGRAKNPERLRELVSQPLPENYPFIGYFKFVGGKKLGSQEEAFAFLDQIQKGEH